MSSHREAPEISKDPVADSTDTYAFVSPDAPDTVTMITNYVPLEGPAAGPNFYEFGDDVLYEINIDNNGDRISDIIYRFTFKTELRNTETFLYNSDPITKLDSPSWNRRQFYTVTKIVGATETVIGDHLPCPPCNIGPRSTPNYASLSLNLIERTALELIARAQGFTRKGLHPTPLNPRSTRALLAGAGADQIDIRVISQGWVVSASARRP